MPSLPLSTHRGNPVDIQRRPVSDLNPSAYNPRKDLQPDDAQYQDIERSLDRFGLIDPLIWNARTGNLVGGHQRLKVLIARGTTEVDVSVVDLSLDDEKALNLALNKVTGLWDDHKLFDVLSDLKGDTLTVTGFDPQELAQLAEALSAKPLYEPKLEPEVPQVAVQRVTEKSVQAAQQKQDGRFAGKAKRVADVVCPHCGKQFGVEADRL